MQWVGCHWGSALTRCRIESSANFAAAKFDWFTWPIEFEKRVA